MELPTYKLRQHLSELKSRLTIVAISFLLSFLICYHYSQEIFQLLLKPFASIASEHEKKIIYTGLAEAFFTYLNMSAFAAFVVSIPVIALEIYLFIRTGLYKRERWIAGVILFSAPILFFIGAAFVFYLVIPKAWAFFVSFEVTDGVVPILLEARISEYLSLIIKLILAFGIAFQMPIVLVILSLFGIISHESLRNKRRIAVVINFIIAGLITPPDILSQIALAIPMLLLYEFSIVACKYVENRGQNA